MSVKKAPSYVHLTKNGKVNNVKKHKHTTSNGRKKSVR